MHNFFEKFKKRSGITSTADLVLILSAFSLAGPTDSLTVRPLAHSIFGLLPKLPTIAYVAIYILLAVPLYQCFLLIYGSLFGQFKFFWEREKKIGRWFRRVFTGSPTRQEVSLQKQEL